MQLPTFQERLNFMAKTFIPVGYLRTLASNLKEGDVVMLKGKIIDVYEPEEPEAWESPETGRIYLLPTTVFYTESVVPGEILEHQVPSSDYVQVLQYEKV